MIEDDDLVNQLNKTFGLNIKKTKDIAAIVDKKTMSSLSDSFTELQNTFNAILTYHGNINNIHSAISSNAITSQRESLLESNPSQSQAISGIDTGNLANTLNSITDALGGFQEALEKMELNQGQQGLGLGDIPDVGGSGKGGRGRGFGKFGKALGAAAIGFDIYDRASEGQGAGQIAAGTGGAAIGGWAGAEAGAALGTAIMPGVGTAAGGLIGGALGYFGGGKAGDAAYGALTKKDKPEAVEKEKPVTKSETAKAKSPHKAASSVKLDSLYSGNVVPAGMYLRDATQVNSDGSASRWSENLSSYIGQTIKQVDENRAAADAAAASAGGGGYGGGTTDTGIGEPVSNPPKSGMAGLIFQTGKKLGYDDYFSVAFTALAEKESGLKPQAENMNYSAARIKQVWKNKPGAVQYAGNPQGLANYIYGGMYGNSGPNDGWLYRGKGLNQITFKGNYAKIGQRIGYDLVKDPDALVRSPEIAVKAFYAYYQGHPVLKGRKQASSQSEANRLVTDATGGRAGFSTGSSFGQANLAKVNQFSSKYSAGGLASTNTSNLGGGPAGAGGPQSGPGQAAGGIKPALASIKSKRGLSVQVAAAYQRNFQGFITDLENSGYPIKALGGYAVRPNVNSPSNLSFHSYGAAIDINPGQNPNKKGIGKGAARAGLTDMPIGTVNALIKKWGIGWGFNWNSISDAMHFSIARSEGGSVNISRSGVAPGEAAGSMGAATGTPTANKPSPNQQHAQGLGGSPGSLGTAAESAQIQDACAKCKQQSGPAIIIAGGGNPNSTSNYLGGKAPASAAPRYNKNPADDYRYYFNAA